MQILWNEFVKAQKGAFCETKGNQSVLENLVATLRKNNGTFHSALGLKKCRCYPTFIIKIEV